MNKYIFRLWWWLKSIFGFKPLYKTIVCEELPDKLMSHTLYLIGEKNNYWISAMVCPCGCNDLIQLAMDQTGRPRWSVQIDKSGLATLYPSVHRNIGCRSHFFLKEGKIVWCNEN
ncbi:MAG: DUF6527 family protein [Methylophilus sp.]|nr:DUF6527 family protein [Methylophilus sp.]